MQTPSAPAAICLPAPRSGFKLASVASARVDQYVLPGRISEVAIALRQIIAGSRGRLSPRDGADRAASDRTGDRAARSTRDKTAQEPADNRATDRARGRVRRWRKWRRRRRRIGHRRRITASNGRSIWTAIIFHGLHVGHISGRTIHLLRIEIPDAPNVPPPAEASVVGLVTPA